MLRSLGWLIEFGLGFPIRWHAQDIWGDLFNQSGLRDAWPFVGSETKRFVFTMKQPIFWFLKPSVDYWFCKSFQWAAFLLYSCRGALGFWHVFIWQTVFGDLHSVEFGFLRVSPCAAILGCLNFANHFWRFSVRSVLVFSRVPLRVDFRMYSFSKPFLEIFSAFSFFSRVPPRADFWMY